MTGINGVMYNLHNVLERAGLDHDIVPFIAVAISALQVLSSIVAVNFKLIDR